MYTLWKYTYMVENHVALVGTWLSWSRDVLAIAGGAVHLRVLH